jgi:hypothetical protein
MLKQLGLSNAPPPKDPTPSPIQLSPGQDPLSIYSSVIKTPGQIGISDGASFAAIDQSIAGLDKYYKDLTSGNSEIYNIANLVSNQPLGNRYFLSTNEKCIRKDGSTVDRYIPIDNMNFKRNSDGSLDTGNYSLVNSAQGALNSVNTDELIDIAKNGYNINSDKNICVPVTMYTDVTRRNTDTKYVTKSDCEKLDATSFSNNVKNCEGFSNISSTPALFEPDDDIITRFYLFSITSIALYALYRLMLKK